MSKHVSFRYLAVMDTRCHRHISVSLKKYIKLRFNTQPYTGAVMWITEFHPPLFWPDLFLHWQLIVAVEQEEIPRLQALYERGLKNNVRDLSIVDAKGIREREPYCRVRLTLRRCFYLKERKMTVKAYSMSSFQGIMALDSPYTGIVDWRMVALRYGKDFEEAGGTVVTEYEVNDISMVNESQAGSTEGTSICHI